MIFTDYVMIAKALQSQNKGKVEEEIMTLKSSLFPNKCLKVKKNNFRFWHPDTLSIHKISIHLLTPENLF